MKEAVLLALSEDMEIDQIQITETGLVVSMISTTPSSCCPLCSQPSSDVHSHYHRTLKDAPCVGRHLQLSLLVRKFFVRAGCRQRSRRASVFCGWGGERQSCRESGPYLVYQQRPGRGASDQIKTPETHYVWEGWIFSSASAGSPCGLTTYQNVSL